MSTLTGTLWAQSLSYTYDSAGRLSGVVYPNGKVMTYAYDAAGNLLRRLVIPASSGPAPVAPAAGVVNAASELGGPVAPGEIVAIYGTGIGPAVLAGSVISSLDFFETYTGETTVTFDGIPAPLLFTSSGQTAAIVPYAVAGQTSTQMAVTYQGRNSTPVTLAVAQAAPGLFSRNASGTGAGAILNSDLSLNTAANAAARGSIIVLYGTGEGQTAPAGVDGRIALSIYPKPVLAAKVTIGGIDATAGILYAGAAPDLVAGVFQVNVKIPSGVAPGAATVVVSFGPFSSQPGLTVSVK